MVRKKKLLNLVALLVLAMSIGTGINTTKSSAETPYKTYTVDGYGRMEETQTAYLAKKTIPKFGNDFLSSPSDMCVTDDGNMYIADTGNGRIVVGTIDGKLVKEIGKGILQTPKGVYVTENKHVYVADRDGAAVYEFDADGNMLNKYGKPDSPLYGDDIAYMPIKVVVNDAGIMFVVCESNTNGIVEISPADGGTFLGYFGTNRASTNLQQIIYRAILTDEQRAKMVSNIPATPDNLAIDEKGLIYTVTRGDKTTTLKRLNIAGTNMNASTTTDVYDDAPAAVAVGNNDNVYVVSSVGYIYEYNEQGEPLYVFGAADDGSQRVGLSNLATSIAVGADDSVYVLDSDRNQVQVYQPSEFTQKLHTALNLYSNGRYEESREPLTEVLQMNSMFDYANKAMGRAYYQENNYSEALRYAKLAKDKDGYTDAFWEIRNTWLQNNIVTVLLFFVALYIIWKVVKVLDRKKGILNGPRAFKEKIRQNKVVSNVMYSGYFMRHPFDGSYGIAREGRASWAAPSIILVIFMIEYVVNKYLCGFLQKTVREGRYDIGSDIGKILIIMIGLTACHYLVCTINEGESTVKKIYTYFCYSLLPYILFTPITFILSHILTNNEQFLITVVQLIMYAWTIVLVLLAIKEVNYYSVKETAKIIFLTFFTILIVALLIFIIYVLWAQVFEFISAVFGEVVYRLGY